MRHSLIPTIQVSNPNGYDDIEAASRLLETSPANANWFDPETASHQQLTRAVTEAASAYARVETGLRHRISNPISYGPVNESDDPFDSVWHYGRLTYAYQKRARLAEIEQRNDDVVSSCLSALVLDGAEQRGGIVSQAIVDNSWWASKKLYKLRESLTEAQCLELVKQLEAIDTEREPFAEIVQRDRAWHERINGWNGQLYNLLVNEWGGNYEIDRQRYQLQTALNRLLIAEIALQAFRTQEQKLPNDFQSLVPSYLAAVPIDPCDPNSGPLHLRTESGTCVAYGVGPDGIDNNGMPPDESLYGGFAKGDLRLDSIYSQMEQTEKKNMQTNGNGSIDPAAKDSRKLSPQRQRIDVGSLCQSGRPHPLISPANPPLPANLANRPPPPLGRKSLPTSILCDTLALLRGLHFKLQNRPLRLRLGDSSQPSAFSSQQELRVRSSGC